MGGSESFKVYSLSNFRNNYKALNTRFTPNIILYSATVKEGSELLKINSINNFKNNYNNF